MGYHVILFVLQVVQYKGYFFLPIDWFFWFVDLGLSMTSTLSLLKMKVFFMGLLSYNVHQNWKWKSCNIWRYPKLLLSKKNVFLVMIMIRLKNSFKWRNLEFIDFVNPVRANAAETPVHKESFIIQHSFLPWQKVC